MWSQEVKWVNECVLLHGEGSGPAVPGCCLWEWVGPEWLDVLPQSDSEGLSLQVRTAHIAPLLPGQIYDIMWLINSFMRYNGEKGLKKTCHHTFTLNMFFWIDIVYEMWMSGVQLTCRILHCWIATCCSWLASCCKRNAVRQIARLAITSSGTCNALWHICTACTCCLKLSISAKRRYKHK